MSRSSILYYFYCLIIIKIGIIIAAFLIFRYKQFYYKFSIKFFQFLVSISDN